ncbi:hypothetical protein F5B20DRAFT_582557 [Whalleya microplaca]|nr:hypothetical protein F5B20DRAFT_582557 [Whalleya microplaca]
MAPRWLQPAQARTPRFLMIALCSACLVSFFLVAVVFSPPAAIRTHLSPQTEELKFSIPTTNFSLPGPPPQVTEKDEYKDRLVGLGTSDPEPLPAAVDTSGLRYAILMPTFEGHFDNTIKFLQDLRCLCVDHNELDIQIIVSDSHEQAAFRALLAARLQPCNSTYSRFPVPPTLRAAPAPRVNVTNLFDILPPLLLDTEGVSADDTSPLLRARGKYVYQSVKKLAAAFAFAYDVALWLDAEAAVVQPFAARAGLFDEWVRSPGPLFRSRMARQPWMVRLMGDAWRVLGREQSSFGELGWVLESMMWMVDKAILNDMRDWVERAHGIPDFWAVWLDYGAPFEILLYNAHIVARKLETTDSVYSPYAVLETEREMIRFGMQPAFEHIEHRTDTGFLERAYTMLRTPAVWPNFSAFLRRHRQRIVRLEELDLAPPEVYDRLLLDTPVFLLASGDVPLHEWWEGRMREGAPLYGGAVNWTDFS